VASFEHIAVFKGRSRNRLVPCDELQRRPPVAIKAQIGALSYISRQIDFSDAVDLAAESHFRALGFRER